MPNIEEIERIIEKIQEISMQISGLVNIYKGKIYGEIELTQGQKQALIAEYQDKKGELEEQVDNLP